MIVIFTVLSVVMVYEYQYMSKCNKYVFSIYVQLLHIILQQAEKSHFPSKVGLNSFCPHLQYPNYINLL